MSEDNHAKLKVQAALCNDEDQETVSVVNTKITKYPLCAWMLIRIYLTMSTCDDSAWSIAARFMAYGCGSCVLNNFSLLMSSVTVVVGYNGASEGCVVAYVDHSRTVHKHIVYGVNLPPSRQVLRHLGVPDGDVHFLLIIPPIVFNLRGTRFMNDVKGHVLPQNSMSARSLSDFDKWIAAECEEMEFI